MATIREKIEEIYRNRDRYSGYMLPLIDSWKKLADEGRLHMLTHNSAKIIERQYELLKRAQRQY
jgi:hypothetical protein